MLILMEWPWLWIVLGAGLMIWGNGLMGFGWRDWLEFWISWPMTFFSEDTKLEKKTLQEQRVEEVVATNPGCFFVLVGSGLIVFGIIRVVS